MVSYEEMLADKAIFAYLHRMIGDEGIELIRRFPTDKEYSDEELAEVTQINLNSVRNTLYTLYEHRLAKYRRIKNNETGWLTYLWQLELENMYDSVSKDLEIIVEKLRKRFKYENENAFYCCKNCGNTVTFSDAMDTQFVCQNCEDQLIHFDNEPLVNALQRRIARIEENLGHV
ncbi:transcription factor [Methanospirillum sp. J.3.6.1-F.2.7.3]|jgi:transcription initiation factor TFIIE subunit alpha|uniref:Transcription factor E n=2 Tax=Methanospirillum TaxID=2202 RepID=A0A8E7AXF8_9EURY|nr:MULTISPECIES: transcription factor [Methanospirillum]MDX8551391.1 transcription factor [Methanospirillum hungatei]NLW77291.1 transcription factor [Methanomicrobiales archaeon]QVV89482.1 transcription factor [Methanospirillum sp. J.3.6.1-F.2.7.3]QXO96229.1 transcription factor [Methanospirillum hungatei]